MHSNRNLSTVISEMRKLLLKLTDISSRFSLNWFVYFVFIARQCADARYWYSNSVRPSVMFRYSMEMIQHILS